MNSWCFVCFGCRFFLIRVSFLELIRRAFDALFIVIVVNVAVVATGQPDITFGVRTIQTIIKNVYVRLVGPRRPVSEPALSRAVVKT